MTIVNLCKASTADDLVAVVDRLSSCSLSESQETSSSSSSSDLSSSFQRDGFVVFHNALHQSDVSILQNRLEEVLRGEFDRRQAPDKLPKSLLNTKRRYKTGKEMAPLGYDGKSQNNRVLQIINIHKCDTKFRELAVSSEIGEMVANLAGWTNGCRLAQDQVWAKPPGARPIVFHRDSPYFMFSPDDVVTVWIALDDMDAELGPLEYVRASHKWGDGRVGSSNSFFQSDNGMNLLLSAARLEGITDPETSLQIISTAGLRAGGISIHHGKTWHGSGRNNSTNRPRRGLGLHFVPAEVCFTIDARKSKLWSCYIPENVSDEDLKTAYLSEEDFPIVWRPSNDDDREIRL
eukprot:scaffold7945_cov183-Alexandrium_tamarense.AAC.9